MNQKTAILSFNEYFYMKYHNSLRKLQHRKALDCIKIPIKLAINRLIFITDSGTIISNLASALNPGPKLNFDNFSKAILASLKLADPISSGFLRFFNLNLFGHNVFLGNLHKRLDNCAKIQMSEFNRTA